MDGGFWAPEITSFSGANEVLDYSVGFQIEALPQTVAFVGIRHLEFELDEGDYEAGRRQYPYWCAIDFLVQRSTRGNLQF